MRVSIIGAGEMGRRHARVFASHPFTPVGVFDRSESRASALAASFGGKAFASEAEAIVASELVIVATPIQVHAETARRAIESGRHVLVEKPICGRLPDAEHLVGLAAEHGVELFVGHSERFNPVIRALASAICPADVLALHFMRAQPFGERGSAYGVLTNLGVHDLDLVAHLTQSSARVVDAHGCDDTAEVVVVTASGALGRVRVDRCSPTRVRTLRVVTMTDVWTGDLLVPRLTRLRRSTGRIDSIPVQGPEPLAAQAAALADAIRGVKSPLATGADGAHALALADRATRRVRATSKRPVSPPAPLVEKL